MSRYIGESPREDERLLWLASQAPIDGLLRWAGLGSNMRVVDAGCGPGEQARVAAKIVGPQGAVRAFDLNETRMAAARAHAAQPDSAPIQFLTGDVMAPPIPDGWADFIYSQGVFEYLVDPRAALLRLTQALKVGGRLLLSDPDGWALCNWPVLPIVEQGLHMLISALGHTGYDPWMGRKLYHLMHSVGLEQLAVRMHPLFNIGGEAPPDIIDCFRQRLEAVGPLGEKALGGSEPWAAFSHAYLAMLADRAVYKFVVVISVAGTKGTGAPAEADAPTP